MNWRLVKTIDTNGAMQMAIDESILMHRIAGSVPNTLRFFTWKPPCLTLGFFQSLEKEVNTAKAKELGVEITRRYTGGGAVLHDKELTYSLAISESDVPQDILESYEKICGALVKGLGRIGIPAEFKPINDILANGKKISGNAQTRKEGVVLQHGTILMDVDVKKMFSLLKIPNEKIKDKMIATAEERVTSLKTLGSSATLSKLENAITRSFEEEFGIVFKESELTSSEIELAEKLSREKYSTSKWCNLR